jgi:hypothetical protein
VHGLVELVRAEGILTPQAVLEKASPMSPDVLSGDTYQVKKILDSSQILETCRLVQVEFNSSVLGISYREMTVWQSKCFLSGAGCHISPAIVTTRS